MLLRRRFLVFEQVQAGHHELDEDILLGLNVLPDLVSLLRREGAPIAVGREISKVITYLSTRPNNMILWLKFQTLHSTAHHFYIDYACQNLAVVKGRPEQWKESVDTNNADRDLLTTGEADLGGGIQAFKASSLTNGSSSSSSETKKQIHGVNLGNNRDSDEPDSEDDSNENMYSSSATSLGTKGQSNDPAIGVQFGQLDGIIVLPRSYVRDQVKKREENKKKTDGGNGVGNGVGNSVGNGVGSTNDSGLTHTTVSPSGSSRTPGVALHDGGNQNSTRSKTSRHSDSDIIDKSWTMSCWFYIRKRPDDTMELSSTSVSSLTGKEGSNVGNYATLCEGINGDQHVCIRVVKDDTIPTDALKKIEKKKKRKERQRKKDRNQKLNLQSTSSNSDNSDTSDSEDENEPWSKNHVRHELGGWDSDKREWRSCGFDMTRVPKGWHHLVVLSIRGRRTFYYIDGKQVGVIPNWTSTSPILSIGNASDLMHPFGVISDFRLYKGVIPKSLLEEDASLLNISPRRRLFEGGAVRRGSMAGNGMQSVRGILSGSSSSSRRALNRQQSLRTTASRALQSHASRSELSSVSSAKSISAITRNEGIDGQEEEMEYTHPWTLLPEYYVHNKLGKEKEGVS